MDLLTIKKIIEINLKKKFEKNWDSLYNNYIDFIELLGKKYKLEIYKKLSIAETPILSIKSFDKNNIVLFYWVGKEGNYLSNMLKTTIANNEELFKIVLDSF